MFAHAGSQGSDEAHETAEEAMGEAEEALREYRDMVRPWPGGVCCGVGCPHTASAHLRLGFGCGVTSRHAPPPLARQVRERLSCASIDFVHINKDRYLLEVNR